jgi:hypothetical protein
MVYTDSHSSQLWVTTSSDTGGGWEEVRHIDGQHSSIPALAAFQDKLWIVYTVSSSSQVKTSSDLHRADNDIDL